MKRDFTNENFESFLRRQTEGLRLRPDDKIWKGISKELNKGRRRFGFGIAAFLIAACTFGYFTIDGNSPRSNTSSKNTASKNSALKSTVPTNTAANTNRQNVNGEEQPGNEAQTNYNIDLLSSLSVADSDAPRQKTVATTVATNSVANASINSLQVVSRNFDLAGEPSSSAETIFTSTIIDNDLAPGVEKTTEGSVPTATEKKLPQSIESVVNIYKGGNVKRKASVEWYFTPTVSYRKLTENKSFIRAQQGSTSPSIVAPSLFDVNNVVTHKPGMGMEMGFAVKYPIGKNLKLRGGLQFNVTRYEIRAFKSTSELATIMLNTRNSGGVDSISRVSRLSNEGSSEPNWLQNLYLQISAPIGAEFTIAGNKKVQFGVATTIQPTYVLGNRAYVISANYKNYAEVPELTRRWNMNTSLETYVAYSTGRLNWQVGPQVRYQLLSSFVAKYPVKENLFDYGLRVGISINK
ncbi:MAG: hypothetical protein V4676_12605 [Bacteroidota bacterium]